MNISVDPKIGEKGPWAENVRRMLEILDMVLNTRSKVSSMVLAQASVHVDLVGNPGGSPLISLTLSDPYASVDEKFRPDELADSQRLWSRLRDFWANFLDARTDRLLEKLTEPEEVTAGDK